MRVARERAGARAPGAAAARATGAARALGQVLGQVVALVVALVIGPAAAGCGNAGAKPKDPEPSAAASKRAAKPPRADATRVEIAVLETSDASLQAVIPGEVEGSRDATLASAQGGPIDRILVEEGDRVRSGQLLAEVDTALYAIRRKQAETELARAQREVDRAEGLGSALSKAERERRQSQVDMLATNVELAVLQMKRSQIRAPFAGVISDIHVEVGEVVAATTPLMRLIKLDPVNVVLSVPDRDVVALSNGSEVDLRISALPEALKGKIVMVSPTGDQETRAFRAEVEVPNPDLKVLPGMIVSAHVDRTLAEGAVVIPQDWLVTRRDGVGVFLDEGGIAKYVGVKAGRVVREQVVIDEGLEPGARLVIKGHRSLADGDPLVVAREGVCCKDGRARF